MGDVYNNETNNINNTCSASSSSRHYHRSSDDISLFLHQILPRSPSSTSSSSFIGPQTLQPFSVPAPFDDPLRSGVILGVDSSGGGGGALWSGNVRTRLIMSENETDHECDCESEEGLEALIDEMSVKPAPPRSSKRTRAADVHNLSEKRRRSRINEKMKALQNLIPNSSKTDKASMLDEAIEYLKLLQLQVQPSQLSQVRMGFDEEIGSKHMNMTTSVPLDGEARLQTMLTLPDHCTSSNQASNPIHAETSSGFQSTIQAHFSPFPLRVSSEETWRKDILPGQQLNVSHAERNPSEFELAAAVTTSLPFGIQACDLKDSISLEACVIGRDQNEGVCLENMEHNLKLSQDLNRASTRR
ncbi:hypothetical protein BDE02_05G118600 [Populus trichocarpa]|nr:hypothetical protein BDE02_05G118600 [Populus trichocarpa]